MAWYIWIVITIVIVIVTGAARAEESPCPLVLPGRAYPVAARPEGIAKGDFDGDGILDLAVANAPGVSILLGKGSGAAGDGVLAGAVTLAAGDHPSAVKAGDLNGDRILDLVLANRAGDDISVLMGNGAGGLGDGTFSPEVRYWVGDRPCSIATGDFNGDGILDLAVANRGDPFVIGSGDVSTLLGQGSDGLGDGTFEGEVRYRVGENPSSIVAADFTGDGLSDLAVASAGDPLVPDDDCVSILIAGTGGAATRGAGLEEEGGFSPEVRYRVGRGPASIVPGDFNGDGIVDLAAASEGGIVSILLGRGSNGVGDGTFAVGPWYPAGETPVAIVTGEFNQDGIADLAVANRWSDDISILLGEGSAGVGDGRFSPQVRYPAGAWPVSVVQGDFNGDGVQDLAVANNRSDEVSLLLGTGSAGGGDGAFSSQARVEVGMEPRSILRDDFNGDGVADLAVANWGNPHGDPESGDVLVCLGEMSGGGWRVANRTRYPAGRRPVSIASGDFNGDGTADLVVANESSDDLSVLLGRDPEGGGGFAPEVRYPAGENPQSVVTGDLDGDRITDLAVANYGGGDISVLLGRGGGAKGDGTFSGPLRYRVGRNPVALVIGDFDGDGWTDIAAANHGSADVSVLLGDGLGKGAFLRGVRYGAGAWPVAIAAGDVNRDGIADLAVANHLSADVSILLGNGTGGVGDGTFAAETRTDVGGRPFGLTAGDLDGDGDLDLAVANVGPRDTVGGGDIAVIINEAGRGGADVSFSPPIRFAARREPGSILAADLDGDGAVDLVAANELSGDLSILFNASPCGPPAPVEFRRGDVDGDGRIGMADVLSILGLVFGDGSTECMDAADPSDDGRVDLVDPVYLLLNIFAGGDPPRPPYPGCGVDPSPDRLSCGRYESCRGGSP